jgi:cytosine/adenosine deaminase-related metal-dependent hydrolase
LATLGGAQVLGRDDIGSLAPGMAADFAAFGIGDVAHAGAGEDLVAALIFCAPQNVAVCVVNGRIVVKDGQLSTLDLPVHLERHNALARELAESARRLSKDAGARPSL